jgi:hypothetical protein
VEAFHGAKDGVANKPKLNGKPTYRRKKARKTKSRMEPQDRQREVLNPDLFFFFFLLNPDF